MSKKDERSGPEDRWLSAKQVSELLGVNRATVINWARRGSIPAVQYGERSIYRFRESDVNAFIEASRIQPDMIKPASTSNA